MSLVLAHHVVSAGVDCVIIGGHAVNFHGYPRSTQDIDMIFRRDGKGDANLYNVLAGLGAFWISDDIDPSTGIEKTVPVTLEFVASQNLMMLGTSLGYLDLFSFIPGMPAESLDELFATAQKSGAIQFASLSWLRKMKQASGRPQDLIDLQYLPTEN